MTTRSSFTELWATAIGRFPELEKEYGASLPVDEQGDVNWEAIRAATARMREPVPRPDYAEEYITDVTAPKSPKWYIPSLLWDRERWKEAGKKALRGAAYLALGEEPGTAVSRVLSPRTEHERTDPWAKYRKGAEAAGPEASGWSRFLSGGLGAVEPILTGIEGIDEPFKPLAGLIHTAPGIGDAAVRVRYLELRDAGFDPISSLAMAEEQASEAGDLPIWKSLMEPSVLDIPVLKGAKALTKVAKAKLPRVPKVSKGVVGLTPDEATELGRLKGQLAIDEELLTSRAPLGQVLRGKYGPGSPGYQPPPVANVPRLKAAIARAKGEIAALEAKAAGGVPEVTAQKVLDEIPDIPGRTVVEVDGDAAARGAEAAGGVPEVAARGAEAAPDAPIVRGIDEAAALSEVEDLRSLVRGEGVHKGKKRFTRVRDIKKRLESDIYAEENIMGTNRLRELMTRYGEPQPKRRVTENLPPELARATPRYNIGTDRRYIPEFESDIDKALFIIAQGRKSLRDENYMDWLRGVFPDMDDTSIRNAGQEVRQHIKDTVSGVDSGDVSIPISRTVQGLKGLSGPAVGTSSKQHRAAREAIWRDIERHTNRGMTPAGWPLPRHGVLAQGMDEVRIEDKVIQLPRVITAETVKYLKEVVRNQPTESIIKRYAAIDPAIDKDSVLGISDQLRIQAPAHEYDALVDDPARDALNKLLEYETSKAIDVTKQGYSSQRTFEINRAATAMFGDASKGNQDKVKQYVSDLMARYETPLEKLEFTLDDPNWEGMGVRITDIYRKEKNGIWTVKPNRMNEEGRARLTVADNMAYEAEVRVKYPLPDNPIENIRSRGGKVSEWVRRLDWSIGAVKIVDDAIGEFRSVMTKEELGYGNWSPGRQDVQAAMRRYEGVTSQHSTFLRDIMEKGSEDLRKLGWVDADGRIYSEKLGTVENPGPVMKLWYSLNDSDQLGELLEEFPEGEIRDAVERQYWNLQTLTKWEEHLRFDADMIGENALKREDYFYRGMYYEEGGLDDIQKNIIAARTKRLTSKKSYQLARNKHTFKEMLEYGFRPLFWNPYDQAAFSNQMGLSQRLQTDLLRVLKSEELGLAKYVDSQTVATSHPGWRPVSAVGAALKGDRFTAVKHTAAELVDPEEHARNVNMVYIMPNKTADVIEDMFGKDDMVKTLFKAEKKIRFWKLDLDVKLDDLIFIPKRLKLFGSLFQQVDFVQRYQAGVFHATLERILRAGKLMGEGRSKESFQEVVGSMFHVAQIPRVYKDMALAQVSPGRRRQLRELRLDKTSWFSDAEIAANPGLNLGDVNNFNMYANGLSTIDQSIFGKTEDVVRVVDSISKSNGWWKKNWFKKLEKYMREGLFEGTYPVLILNDVRHNLIPILRRLEPDINAQQLMGTAARQANIKWSTLPASQSVFKGNTRSVLERLMFSLNEFETMGRQHTRMFRGPDKRFWMGHWVGMFASIVVAANILHFTTTSLTRGKDGKWGLGRGSLLPLNRYVPFRTNKYNTLGFGYNTELLSPDFPTFSRSGDTVMLDLLMQFDYAFRLLDDGGGVPTLGFFNSRLGTVPRVVVNQASGKDYTGRDIARWGLLQRGLQFAHDMLAPIGAGELALAATSQVFKEKELPQVTISSPVSDVEWTLIHKGASIRDIFPSPEARLVGTGPGGLVSPTVEALGFNLRPLSNERLYDQMVRNTFTGENPLRPGVKLTSWDELRGRDDYRELSKIIFRDPSNVRQVKELDIRRREGYMSWYDDSSKMLDDIRQLTPESLGREARLIEAHPSVVDPQNKDNPAFSSSEFRKKLATIRRDKRVTIEAIEKQYGSDPRTLHDIEKRSAQPDLSTDPVGWASWQYRDIRTRYKDPVTGDVDYEMVRDGKTLEQAWEAEQASWDYMEEEEEGPGLRELFEMHQSIGAEHHPVVQEYYDALSALKDANYWQTEDVPGLTPEQGDVLESTLNFLKRHTGDMDPKEIWREYLRASPEQKRVLQSEVMSGTVRAQVIRSMKAARNNHRINIREQNPDLDRVMIKWFGNTPVRSDNKEYYYDYLNKYPSRLRKPQPIWK